MRAKAKETLEKMIHEFSLVESRSNMLEKYQWFSLASGIKDDQLTLELMREIFKEKHGLLHGERVS